VSHSDVGGPTSCGQQRVRLVGMDAVDSSSDLLDFLGAGDAALGSGEFVRSGSYRRSRRRSQVAAAASVLTDGRERATPSPPTRTPTPDGEDQPPLIRGAPGRWSLRDRVSSGRTSSPPSAPSWSRFRTSRTSQDMDGTSSLHVSARRGINDDCLTAPPVITTTTSDLVDRQSTLSSGRLSPWTPTFIDLSESTASTGNSSRDNLSVATTRRRWSMYDRAIHEVEETGKQIDRIVTGTAADKVATVSCTTAETRENSYRTASDKEKAATSSERLRSTYPGNETKRWDVVVDNEEEPCTLSRSATLPVRQRRYDNLGRPISNEDRMEDIPESPPLAERSHPASNSPGSAGGRRSNSDAADSGSSTRAGAIAESHKLDGTKLAVPPRETEYEIPADVSRLPSTGASETQPAQSQHSSLTTMDEATATTRPASVEFDNESTSSGSRDEGFESAVDTPQGQPDDGLTSESEETSLCDGEESVSAGTSLFARSIDSLVLAPHELVISTDTIDIDRPAAQNVTNSRTTQSTGNASNRRNQPTTSGTTVSGSNQKSANSKSSLLGRLTRPKKSTSSVQQTEGAVTGKPNSADAKPTASSSAAVTRTARTSGTAASGTSAKSSSFVRGSVLSVTMPASLRSARTKKSTTPTTAVSKDALTPELSRRPVRDSKQRPQRPSLAASVVSEARKLQRKITTKADKQFSQQSMTVPARGGRVSAGETSSKDRDKAPSNGRDKLVLYMPMKSPVSSTAPSSSSSSSSGNNKKQTINANNEAHRTQRLTSFNTPQQSRTFRY